ncbi:hypothetical protein AB8P06_19990 [Chryseobacterium sp. MD-1]
MSTYTPEQIRTYSSLRKHVVTPKNSVPYVRAYRFDFKRLSLRINHKNLSNWKGPTFLVV